MLLEKIESQSYDPLLLLKDCLDELYANSDVHIKRVDVDAFYTELAKFPDGDNPALKDLDGAFAACIGGVFRSPRMAKYLKQKGVSLAGDNRTSGFSISKLPELFSDAQVVNGHLVPKGFKQPVKNLFLGINTETEGCEGMSLFCTIHKLSQIQSASSNKIKLNIYIIDGGETESAGLYRSRRAYDPELDGNNEPQEPTFNSV